MYAYEKMNKLQGKGLPRVFKASWTLHKKAVQGMALEPVGNPINFSSLPPDHDIIRQLRRIYAQISQHKIIHYDDNVHNLLVKGGKVSIIDFGNSCEPSNVDDIPAENVNATTLYTMLREAGVPLELDLKGEGKCAQWLGDALNANESYADK
jgi:tRNA A-37 threonylcarbamoyl transferase component Bud32